MDRENERLEPLEKESLGSRSDQPLLNDTESRVEPKIEKLPREGTKGAEIRAGLLAGASEQELADEGYNAKSVRLIAQKLDKQGLRTRPSGSPGTKRRDKNQQKALAK